MSESTSFGSSTSSNSSFIPSYPQSDILMQIAQMASQLGQQQYQWAQGQFAKTSQVTDQAVGNYLDASNMAKSLAGNNLDRYTHLFQPVENQLVDDANTYGSDARVRSEMGAAESGVGQSFDAARKNREQQLQSFGIDPSSGRYAELDRADDTARAAAQAGAGQAARYNTENTGRQLRSQAIQVGQQYPGQIANTLNAQANDLAGMQNASLGNANTGANMFNSAKGFFDTASQLKFPPLGTRGGSNSSQNSQSSRPGGGGGSRGSGDGSGSRGGGSPPGGGGGYNSPVSTQDQYGYQARPSRSINPNASVINNPYDNGDGSFGIDPSQSDYQTDPTAGWGAGTDGYGSTGDGSFGQNGGYGAWDGSDPWASNGNGGMTNDVSGGGYGNDPYSGSNYDPFGNGGGYDGGSAFDTSAAYTGDISGGYSDTGGYDYAAGGAIPDDNPTTGGFVDQSLSPSQGQQTDDIPANLNANEFVIPRDVALWKGQEFFQKLIEQSRKARGVAPAQGKPAPAPQGAPRFVSQGA